MNWEEKKQDVYKVCRYILVSIMGYASLLLLMSFFINLMSLPETISFSISYFILLIADYLLNLKFVFRTKQNKYTWAKYLLYIGFFQLLSTSAYHFLISTDINPYILSYLVLFSLFPLKFLATRYIVFK